MVKLSEGIIRAIEGQYAPQTLMDSALALARDGWHVFPLRPGTKIPLLSKKNGGNGAHDGTLDPDQIRSWWEKYPNAGIGANLGEDRLAVDIDINHGGSRPPGLPDTRTHHSGRGNGNHHLIYKIAPGSLASTIRSGTHVLGTGVDIRAGRGSYIVMPPTPHEETGEPYRLDPAFTREHTLTDDEVLAIWGGAGVTLGAASRGASRGLSVVQGGKSSFRPMESQNSTLAGLLADPPKEGGRNDWLARVCGHLAKKHHGQEDSYRQMVYLAADKIQPPLDPAEIDKTLDSIWEKEHADHPERALTEENGFITGNKARLF
jgi:hypothetical protein